MLVQIYILFFENLLDVNGWKLIHHEKMKTAEGKCPEGLNIFMFIFNWNALNIICDFLQ